MVADITGRYIYSVISQLCSGPHLGFGAVHTAGNLSQPLPTHTIVSEFCTLLRSNLMLKLTLLCERFCNSCSTCYQEMPIDRLFMYFMKHLPRIREVYITCRLVKPSNGHSPEHCSAGQMQTFQPKVGLNEIFG